MEGTIIVENIICMFANLFRIYILYRFFHAFFGKAKTSVRVETALYGVYFIINTSLYIAYHLAWVNITNSLAGIILLSLLYEASIPRAFFVSVLIYVISMICDIVATVPFTHYEDGKNTAQLLFLLCDLLIMILELLIEKIVNTSEEQEDQHFPLMLILIPFCSVLIISLLTYYISDPDIAFTIISIGLLFINFFVLYLYNIILNALNQSYENKILNQNIAMYENQLNLIRESETQISTLRHDMKHHLTELEILTRQGDQHGVQNYIADMQAYIQSSDEIIRSGNDEVDCLLNYLISGARKQLHTVEIQLQLPEQLSGSFDINMVLGNLLENAIEAAVQTEDKILRGSIIWKQGVLRIHLQNSYNHAALRKEHSRFLTTKRHGKGHGIGLKSVRHILEKYHGTMDIQENDLFCISAVMYIPMQTDPPETQKIS